MHRDLDLALGPKALRGLNTWRSTGTARSVDNGRMVVTPETFA
jgi:hypothetical protein